MIILRSIFICFTVWVTTSLMNGLAAGSFLAFADANTIQWGEAFVIIFLCTLFFSIPAIFIWWIVLLNCRESPVLFRSMLKATLVLSILSSLLLHFAGWGMPAYQAHTLSLIIVITSLATIMMHHRRIQAFQTN